MINKIEVTVAEEIKLPENTAVQEKTGGEVIGFEIRDGVEFVTVRFSDREETIPRSQVNIVRKGE